MWRELWWLALLWNGGLAIGYYQEALRYFFTHFLIAMIPTDSLKLQVRTML